MSKTAKEILQHQGYLESDRMPWDTGIWQDVANNFNVLREDMAGNDPPGKKQGIRLYDGTPVAALNLFADGLHGAIISPAITWFVLELPRKFAFLADIPQVAIWLQEVQAGLYAAFANSNFYSEMRPYFRDGGSVGTASISCEEDIGSGRLIFNTRHPNEGYIAVNKFGEVDTYNRKFEMTARQAEQTFKDTSNFSSALKNALGDNGNPYTKFKFLQSIYPRTDFDERSLSSTKKRFASTTIELLTDKMSSPDNHPILRESGFDMFPIMVWRYFVSGKEVYGRSPCMFALNDSETLQTMSRSHTRFGEMAADPSMMIPAEMAGRVRNGPGGMNYYGDDATRILKPVGQGGNYGISIDREDKKREMIEKHLNVDFFLMLAQAQRQMTAEEVRERIGEKATVLSAAIGNLTSVLDRIIDFVFAKELDSGRIPQPPDILIETMGGERINTDYLGPLAQAQKRLFERSGIVNGLEAISPLAAVYGEEVLDLVNPKRAGLELLKAENFPASALNTPEEIRANQESRAAAAEEANRKDDAERQAAIAKDLSQAKKNSGGDLAELAEQVAV